MIHELFSTSYGLIAVAATAIGLLLPLGFHLFIRRKIRESELAQQSAASAASSPSPAATAARRVVSPRSGN